MEEKKEKKVTTTPTYMMNADRQIMSCKSGEGEIGKITT
jgi:hypothetical protein